MSFFTTNHRGIDRGVLGRYIYQSPVFLMTLINKIGPLDGPRGQATGFEKILSREIINRTL